MSTAGGANTIGIGVNISGVGARRLEVGGTDSAGAGYRAVRVSN
jgi:hypothetical protein